MKKYSRSPRAEPAAAPEPTTVVRPGTRPCRVSWEPLSRMLTFSERRRNHSGRPAIEQVPTIAINRLVRQLDGSNGALITLASETREIEQMVAVSVTTDGGRGSMRVAWEVDPLIGEAETVSMTLAIRQMKLGGPASQWAAICPHCKKDRYVLRWAVTTFACRECLGIRSECVRGRKGYTLERRVRRLRQKLGLEGVPLSPIFVDGRSARRRRLASKLWEAEMELMATVLKGGLS